MWKKVSAIVIPTVIAVALLGYMLMRVWNELQGNLDSILESLVPSWLIAAIGICVLAWFLRGFRYKYIIKKLGTEIGLIFSTACIYVSQTANLIIPARLGDFVRMFILKHEKGMPYTNSFTSLIVERVYDILVLAVLGLCALPFLISLVPKDYGWFVWLIIFVLIAGIVGIIILLLAKWMHAENKILNKILEVFAQFRQVSSTIPALGLLSGTSVIIWMMDVLTCYLVCMMLAVDIPFMLVLLAIIIGNLIKAVPITPGGIGTYEAALAIVFEIGGVASFTAFLIAVIDHLIKNLVTLVGGMISLYYFGDWSVSLLKRLFKEDTKKIREENNNL
ncbi:lysylphosphatidylglycerol synthase transmembrane domain-containing protein [uncultured Methanocorpusculum sp.]|nr:lysylphosphatidylglycerol synthase transmembrane domain-containing protein [uncultured Methanocorpusculum sp.]